VLCVLFTILNFDNGKGWISLSAYWQSVVGGLVLLAVVVLQARLADSAQRPSGDAAGCPMVPLLPEAPVRGDLGLALFGSHHGRRVYEIALGKPEGVQTKILTWGAVIRDLTIPVGPEHRQGVVLGFESFADYPAHSPYFDALVGHFANRISKGGFVLDGTGHVLIPNESATTSLHGGPDGFLQRVWDVMDLSRDSVAFGLASQDCDLGFPSVLTVRCRYALTGTGTLRAEFRAQTTHTTVINLS